MADEISETSTLTSANEVTAAPEAEQAEAPATTAQPTEGNPPAETSQATPEGETPAEPATKQPSRATERIRRLLQERNELRQQLAEAQATPETPMQPPTAPPTPPPTPMPDPLAGLPKDDNGYVWLNGKWVDPDTATVVLSERANITQLLDQRDQEAARAKREAEVREREQREWTEYATAVAEEAANVRDVVFGNDLPKETAQTLDRALVAMIDADVTTAFREGQATPELVTDMLTQHATALRTAVGRLTTRQLSSNEQHREQTKVQPGTAVAGSPAPKNWRQMSRAEQEAAAAQAAEAAVKMRPTD